MFQFIIEKAHFNAVSVTNTEIDWTFFFTSRRLCVVVADEILDLCVLWGAVGYLRAGGGYLPYHLHDPLPLLHRVVPGEIFHLSPGVPTVSWTG